ncbi:MAG TPA: energy-coupling factor transporter transmembrane protein EcfT [Actinomycetales bacterium]|nr:energy-coupling factor transporter transmembrane protein EcfT [Actinomycetales bacterium]
MIGLFRPGTSTVHRAPAGAKLLVLALGAVVLVLLRTPVAVAVAAGLVVGLYLLAALSPRDLLRQVWPLRWVVVVLLPFQWWTAGWRTAVVVVGTMLVLVATAGLVTLTTRTTALLDLFEWLLSPLRHVGVDPQRVSLLLALTIRAVPVLVDTLSDARDARRARGLERSPRALLVPVVVRTMRHADRLGEALVARGVDD